MNASNPEDDLSKAAITSTGHTVAVPEYQKKPIFSALNSLDTTPKGLSDHTVLQAAPKKAYLPNPIGHLKVTRKVIAAHQYPENQRELEQYKQLLQYYINYLIRIDHIICFGAEKESAIHLARKKLSGSFSPDKIDTILGLLGALEFTIDNETDERILLHAGEIKGCENIISPLLKASALDYAFNLIHSTFRIKHGILYPNKAKGCKDMELMLSVITVSHPEFSVALRSLIEEV